MGESALNCASMTKRGMSVTTRVRSCSSTFLADGSCSWNCGLCKEAIGAAIAFSISEEKEENSREGEDCIVAVDASGDAAHSGSGDRISTDFPLSAELEGECQESSSEEPGAGAKGDALVSTGGEMKLKHYPEEQE
ncbi:hypothetical protein RIR_jg1140.t1 [Rhizophagus irregularis DAOM 181602=DAOM 197198]|nr:hypothetical protein RIR_jg1140.t1 [Rhizophagus irregularis DAOM 181602=DAOM 197198]